MSEASYRMTNALGRAALRVLRIDTHISGAEHLPTSGPVLMAATHVSYPDFLFLGRAAIARQRYIRFMCRHDVWHVPGVRAAMDRMRHVPVDREAPAGAYLEARALLREGEAVCAFPEAGISYSYTVRSLMRGVASLARETGARWCPWRCGAASGSGASGSPTSSAVRRAPASPAGAGSTSPWGSRSPWRAGTTSRSGRGTSVVG